MTTKNFLHHDIISLYTSKFTGSKKKYKIVTGNAKTQKHQTVSKKCFHNHLAALEDAGHVLKKGTLAFKENDIKIVRWIKLNF